MRKIATYILAAAALCLASCISLEDGFIPAQEGQKMSVMASVADFSSVNIGTKALEEEESEVMELTMIVFDSEGKIVARPVNLSGGNSVFMIDTQNATILDEKGLWIDMNKEGHDASVATEYQAKLNACTIYMVANCWEVLKKETINNISDLLTVDIQVEKIGIPDHGIPMIGFKGGFDLSIDRTSTASTVADIVMDKLYAKVNVRFQINADQVVNTPSFTLSGWTVSNIPAKVRLGEPAAGAETANATGDVLATTKSSTTLSYGVQTITHSESAANPDYFQFTFYVPEHKVNPTINVTDTVGVPRSEWQRYKPKFCSNTQKPMFVTVKGAYTDHHGQVRDVTYSLYLGQNNTDNFHINRNQELNNIITIKGLTNSVGGSDWNPNTPENNISVDHRVDVADNGFSISMEREALLDSHFEVRPMDVFVSNGGKVVVTVNSDDNDATDDWLRIEKSTESAAHIAGVGVRKYFTTDLVNTTLASIGRSVTINSGDDSRIWLYFDENPNHYDKTIEDSPMYRDITLTVDYYADASSNVVTKSQTFSFRQMNLWRVRGTTHYYDIEYHEEYLHNYVSNDNYGKRKDGMPWGLVNSNGEGLQLSDYMKSFYLETNFATISNALMESSKPYYDFYITAAEANQTQNYRPYSGKIFSNEIMEKILFEINDNSLYVSDGLLTSDPKSAVDYCYNKNKRSSNGSIITATTVNNTTTYNTDNVKWFLPSIDQIEEIVRSAYQDFEDFQAKWYWSSQPAYDRYNYTYNAQFGLVDQVSGNFYTDDLSNARATMTIYDNGWTSAPSGSDSTNDKTRVGSHTWTSMLWYVDHNYVANSNYDEDELELGNQPRTAINRIRCVRNSGLVSELTSSTN